MNTQQLREVQLSSSLPLSYFTFYFYDRSVGLGGLLWPLRLSGALRFWVSFWLWLWVCLWFGFGAPLCPQVKPHT